jgi:hypothetical protein
LSRSAKLAIFFRMRSDARWLSWVEKSFWDNVQPAAKSRPSQGAIGSMLSLSCTPGMVLII